MDADAAKPDAAKVATRGRDEVLAAWFRAHYASLHRVAHLMLGDAAEADEVVMDAFAKALARWRLFRSLDSPPAYLRRVVVNDCRSRVRRRAVERRALALVGRRDDVVNDADHGARVDLWRAVLTLPDRQRACVALRYLDDMREEQIAEVLGVPLGTVKSQLSRARRKLRDALEEVPRGAR